VIYLRSSEPLIIGFLEWYQTYLLKRMACMVGNFSWDTCHNKLVNVFSLGYNPWLKINNLNATKMYYGREGRQSQM